MLHLRTSHKKTIELLVKHSQSYKDLQKDQGEEFNFYAVVAWAHTTIHLLETIYGETDKHTIDYLAIIKNIPTDDVHIFTTDTINLSRAILLANINEIQTIIDNPEFQEPDKDIRIVNADEKILYVFSKFHNAAKILERNRKGCSSFSINNEYDVQLLIYSLLSVQFEHIRIEEPTGSHAGSASKMDFVLDEEKTIIEIKYSFEGHIDKEIGNELLIDIAKYENVKKYSKFFCFIYDPNNNLRNASILKKDLEEHKKEDFEIIIIIEPKR